MKRVEARRSLLSIIVCLAAMTAVPSQSAPRERDDLPSAYRQFKANYEAELQRSGIVGSSFYLIRDNRVVARELYGLADAERGRPVDEETIYHWASVTKTFTGIAIMH